MLRLHVVVMPFRVWFTRKLYRNRVIKCSQIVVGMLSSCSLPPTALYKLSDLHYITLRKATKYKWARTDVRVTASYRDRLHKRHWLHFLTLSSVVLNNVSGHRLSVTYSRDTLYRWLILVFGGTDVDGERRGLSLYVLSSRFNYSYVTAAVDSISVDRTYS